MFAEDASLEMPALSDEDKMVIDHNAGFLSRVLSTEIISLNELVACGCIDNTHQEINNHATEVEKFTELFSILKEQKLANLDAFKNYLSQTDYGKKLARLLEPTCKGKSAVISICKSKLFHL